MSGGTGGERLLRPSPVQGEPGRPPPQRGRGSRGPQPAVAPPERLSGAWLPAVPLATGPSPGVAGRRGAPPGVLGGIRYPVAGGAAGGEERGHGTPTPTPSLQLCGRSRRRKPASALASVAGLSGSSELRLIAAHSERNPPPGCRKPDGRQWDAVGGDAVIEGLSRCLRLQSAFSSVPPLSVWLSLRSSLVLFLGPEPEPSADFPHTAHLFLFQSCIYPFSTLGFSLDHPLKILKNPISIAPVTLIFSLLIYSTSLSLQPSGFYHPFLLLPIPNPPSKVAFVERPEQNTTVEEILEVL